MTAVLAAVELFWETPEPEPQPEATAPPESITAAVPIARARTAGAQAPTAAAAGLAGSVWAGIKRVARAAGRLISIGTLAVAVLVFARKLWLEVHEFDDDSGRERGRVLQFPGPRLQERP